MNTIELQLRAYLEAVVKGEAEMPSSIIREAARQFERALERQFNPRAKQEFRLRLSNIGRPTCQLWYEKNNAPAEDRPYSFPMKMAFGDAVEIIAMAAMKAAGIDIEAINEAGEIEVAGETIRGTSDVTIDGKIWDIKGVSSYSFTSTYANPYGYKELSEHDDFGYLAQGVGYSIAIEKPFGGWIAVNKESGEIAILEMPEDDITAKREDIVKGIENTVVAVKSDEKPPRAFEDVEEKFKKKPTGNRILSTTCKYCDYKQICWPNLQFAANPNSSASNPEWKYYTHLEKPSEN